jgi:Flp pilus assembly protein TadD
MNKLGYPARAAALLKPSLNGPATTDGLRFEYVRYAILSGEKDAASRVLKQLVKKHPDNKDLLKSLVAMQLNRKKWDSAEKSAKKLMQFKAYRSDAAHFMGEIHEARGDNAKALRAYLQVVDGQLYTSALKHIPKLIEKQQGLEAARRWLQKRRDLIVKQALNSKQLRVQKAILYKAEADLLFAHKDYQAAQGYLQRALVLAPADNEIIYARALVYEQLGQIGLAEKDLKRVIKQDMHNPSTLNALGYLLAVHTDRLDEAMQLIKKAQQISPDDAAINDSLGWLHYRRGEMKTAEHYLRKSYQAMKQPDVARHLIEVLQKRGQKQEAKTILYQMLRQFPDDKKLKGISIN